jgi:hypothetical protein
MTALADLSDACHQSFKVTIYNSNQSINHLLFNLENHYFTFHFSTTVTMPHLNLTASPMPGGMTRTETRDIFGLVLATTTATPASAALIKIASTIRFAVTVTLLRQYN